MWHWFPIDVSTHGQTMDGLFMIILWITGFIFIAVEAVLIYFAFKYRHRPGRRAFHIHGDLRTEIIWTAIPFVIVMYIAVISIGPWLDLRNPDRFPPADLEVLVTAKQFEWNVTYPGPDNVLGTADDFVRRNELEVPVGRNVVVHLEAEDVIHSFFLPQLRVKQDAVPGMRIPVWFQATQAGTYMMGCAELCGLGHYRMRGSVNVRAGLAFDAWHASGGQAAIASEPASPTVIADHSAHDGH